MDDLRQNLRCRPKDEKPNGERINFHQTYMVSNQRETKGSCPNDQLQMKKWNEHRQKLESCANNEKQVQYTNELRLNLDDVPKIGCCLIGEKLKVQTIKPRQRLGAVPMMTNQSKK